MKTFYCEAKQHLSNCMLHNATDTPSSTPSTPTSSTSSSTASSPSLRLHRGNHFIAAAATATATAAATATASGTSRTAGETSAYDTLQPPFKYDRFRGRWSSAADFFFACTSHAFGSILFSELPVYAMLFGGVYFLPTYLIAILLYAIPIFAIQTFLGQFSTSGAISAFRVAPIFKGIGYSVVLLNLTSLAHYGIIAAIPIVYAANSLHTVIPWMSCDNAWNTQNCSTHSFYDGEEEFIYPHATVEFFRSVISSANDSDYTISWPILCGLVGVWLVALGVLLKGVPFIGKCLRCACIVMLSLFLSIFVYLIIHTKITWATFAEYFEPILPDNHVTIIESLRTAILMATWLLGPGWGSVLTLASHNNFNRDSEKLTYWVSGIHIILTLMAMICGRIALDHFEDHVGLFHYHVEEEHYMQFIYLCFAYLFGSLTSLPNFWSFLFFTMLFMAELSAIIVQMMSVLTAIFDEYEKTRTKKTGITILLTLIMMTVSVYFCTKQGFEHLHVLPNIVVLTHLIISTLLLLMTTWIYGRERFQCDLQFMLGKTISNLKILMIRFLTPAFLVISIIQTIYLLETNNSPTALMAITQSVIYLVAPAYMIYKICQTNGTLRNRLKQCFAPHDWYPVEATHRRFYEEIMGTSEMLVIDGEDQLTNA